MATYTMQQLMDMGDKCDTIEEKQAYSRAMYNDILECLSDGYWTNEVGERFPYKPFDYRNPPAHDEIQPVEPKPAKIIKDDPYYFPLTMSEFIRFGYKAGYPIKRLSDDEEFISEPSIACKRYCERQERLLGQSHKETLALIDKARQEASGGVLDVDYEPYEGEGSEIPY